MTLSLDSLPSLRVLEAPATLRRPIVSMLHEYPILLAGTDCVIKPQVALSDLTTFQVGGPAEWYVAPRDVNELQASLHWAAQMEQPLTLLGAGSNLLISDEGLPGLVIGTRHLRYCKFDEAHGRVTVGAGEMLPALARRIARQGWRGFEWAVGIPGSIGGAVVMNAGAHTGCVADILVSTTVVNADGSIEVLTPDALQYQYRTSNLQRNRRFVLEATFQLQPGFEAQTVLEDTHRHMNQRRNSQPYDRPNCGSVFRNPTEEYKAGWLIEQAGLKGYRIGNAQVAERHANFILNCGGATATDIFRLINHVQTTVQQQWSLMLEPEVRILGDFQAA